jgi:hypothetical protein
MVPSLADRMIDEAPGRVKMRRVGKVTGRNASGGVPTNLYTAVILRCSPFFTASLEGWPQALVAVLRDAAQARGSSG